MSAADEHEMEADVFAARQGVGRVEVVHVPHAPPSFSPMRIVAVVPRPPCPCKRAESLDDRPHDPNEAGPLLRHGCRVVVVGRTPGSGIE